jgi:hypothetical protein
MAENGMDDKFDDFKKKKQLAREARGIGNGGDGHDADSERKRDGKQSDKIKQKEKKH